MAAWKPLRDLLVDVEDTVTFTWSELDSLVGGLPRSAYDHPAFWKGNRSGWPGFTTTNVRVGESVTFVRTESRATASSSRAHRTAPPPDVVLVGCVKQKLDRPAPARDLYTSDLFQKARGHAERAGELWFILSAEHGLVSPTQEIAPYERSPSKQPVDYRQTWGARVVQSLQTCACRELHPRREQRCSEG